MNFSMMFQGILESYQKLCIKLLIQLLKVHYRGCLSDSDISVSNPVKRAPVEHMLKFFASLCEHSVWHVTSILFLVCVCLIGWWGEQGLKFHVCFHWPTLPVWEIICFLEHIIWLLLCSVNRMDFIKWTEKIPVRPGHRIFPQMSGHCCTFLLSCGYKKLRYPQKLLPTQKYSLEMKQHLA